MVTKDLGMVTAYAYAVAGGYEGTEEEFEQLMADLAIEVDEFDNFSVSVTTLPAGSSATASYSGGVLSLGIPKGDKGETGTTGATGATGAAAGFGTVSASVDANVGTPSVEVTASGADTAKNFAFAFHNLKGDKGDTGEVSEAELAQAFEDFSANGVVANAEQLISTVTIEDQTPYLFRTSGGSVDIGDREVDSIVGVSYPWNQLIQNGNFADGFSKWSTSAATASASDGVLSYISTAQYGSVRTDVSWEENHKYLLSVDIKGDSALTTANFNIYNGRGVYFQVPAITTSWNRACTISNHNKTSGTVQLIFQDNRSADWDAIYLRNVQIFDLTLMFGSAIADYIYSLEQATAGAGVARFRNLFPKSYYAYNACELMSVRGLKSHDMRGFNAWDEAWELGGISTETGQNQTGTNIIRAKNYIPVIQGMSYYFKAPAGQGGNIYWYDADKNFISAVNFVANSIYAIPNNASFVRFRMAAAYGTTYKNDICINLSWDGERDGEYEPYELHSYALDDSLTLRGMPKLDSSNNLYYDGDTYESDGTVTRKYYECVFDGTIQYTGSFQARDNTSRCYYDYSKLPVAMVPNNSQVPNIVADFPTYKPDYVYSNDVEGISENKNATAYGFWISIANSKLSEQSAAGIQAYLAQHPITVVYPRQTPTTESAQPYINPQIVDDFGTEEYVIDSTIDVPIPVGHVTKYQPNLRAKLEMAPDSPSDGDGDYIVRQTSGVNEYVLLQKELPALPTTDGTYHLECTVSGGVATLTWESE